ncbi:hypothetical protein J2X17_002512 [Flavobacterium aquidurense]|nr:hypothetical protein [Flavobacterium aquidurense]
MIYWVFDFKSAYSNNPITSKGFLLFAVQLSLEYHGGA